MKILKTVVTIVGGSVLGLLAAMIFVAVFFSIAARIEEAAENRRNRKEGNLKITVDKAKRFKQN